MSIELVNLSYKIKYLLSSEHSTLNVLAFRADEKTYECWPSAKSLCESTSLDKKTVYKALVSLSEKKLIVKTGEMKGKTKSTPVYRVTLSVPVIGYAQKPSVPVISGSLPKNGSPKLTQKRYMENSDLKSNKKDNSDAYATSTSKTKKPTITELQEFAHGVKGYEWVGEWRKENGYG